MRPTDKLDVTLAAEQWEAVMRIMAQAPVPYAVVAPLLNEIQRQCTAPRPAAEGADMPPPSPPTLREVS